MQTVYISDLDGTLLNARAELSAFSRQAIEALLDEGVLFSVASARSLFSIRSILGTLPLTLPVISFNGGYVSDYQSGRHLVVRSLSDDTVAGLHETISTLGLHPFVSTHSERGDHLYVGRVLNSAMAWFFDERRQENDSRLRQVDDVAVAYEEQVTCVSVMGDRQPLERLLSEIERAFGDQVQTHLFENQYVAGAHWLTVHAGLATKANGIDVLLDTAGLTGARTVVFGDHHNDMAMFRAANEGVAMAQAVPALKAIATQCIGSNEEDAVVREIRRRCLSGS
jgi:Cof subfamily protein (haloacid dehalogenase superfamily)